QLAEVNLVDRVGHLVVVRMQARKEENDGDAFGGITEVIAAEVDALGISRIVHLEIDIERNTQAGVGIDQEIMEFSTDAVCAYGIYGILLGIQVIPVSTDHIDIELGNDAADRNRRMIGEKFRSP